MRVRYALNRLATGLLFLLVIPAGAQAENPCADWPTDPQGDIPPLMDDPISRAPLGRVRSLRVDVYAGERQAEGNVAKQTPERRTTAPYSSVPLSLLGVYPVFHIQNYPSQDLYARDGKLTEQTMYGREGATPFRVRPAYGEHGRLESETVCRGAGADCAVIRYAYEPESGRLIAITPDAAWPAMERELTWGETVPCSVRYAYDASGRLSSVRAQPTEMEGQGGTLQEEAMIFTYEEETSGAPCWPGYLCSVIYESRPGGEQPLTFRFRYEKNASGLWRYEDRIPGRAEDTVASLWDEKGNVLRIRQGQKNSPTSCEQVYERDEKGRIVRITRSSDSKTLQAGNLACRYTYDGQGRLIRAALDFDGRKDWQVKTYEYDAHDNCIRAGISDMRSTPSDGGEPRPVVIERFIEYWE